MAQKSDIKRKDPPDGVERSPHVQSPRKQNRCIDIPTYYHQVFKMPLEKASSIMSIVTIGGTVGCLAGGMLPMRVGRRRPFIVIPGIMMGVTALCAVFFNNPLVMYPSAALFGMFGNLQNPSLFTMPMELPDMSVRSGVVVIAIMQCVGNLGNFVGPLMVGYLVDLTGSFLPGFVAATAASLSLLIAGLMVPETGPRGVKQPSIGTVEVASK